MEQTHTDIDLYNRDTLLQLITTYKNKGKIQIVELLKDLENLSAQNELLNDTVEYYSQIINTFKNIKTEEIEKLNNILQQLKEIKPASDLQQRQIHEQLINISQKLESLKNN